MKLGRSSSSIAEDAVEVGAVEAKAEEGDDEAADAAVEPENAEDSPAPRNTRSQCFFSAGTRSMELSIASRDPDLSTFTVYLPARIPRNINAPLAFVLVSAAGD